MLKVPFPSYHFSFGFFLGKEKGKKWLLHASCAIRVLCRHVPTQETAKWTDREKRWKETAKKTNKQTSKQIKKHGQMRETKQNRRRKRNSITRNYFHLFRWIWFFAVRGLIWGFRFGRAASMWMLTYADWVSTKRRPKTDDRRNDTYPICLCAKLV